MGNLTKVVLREQLEKMHGDFAMALPTHITPEKVKRVVLTEFSKNPKLAECSQNSVLRSVMEACQYGLEPNGVTGSAYLVPYGKECQLIVGYKGLLKLAYQAGVKSIEARDHRENDVFKMSWGTESHILHIPADGDRGELKGVYAVADMGSGKKFEYLSVHQCKEIMFKTASKGSSGPWKTNFESMCLKSALRKLCKTLPLDSERLAMAVDHKEGDEGLQYDFESKDFEYVVDESENSKEVKKDDANS